MFRVREHFNAAIFAISLAIVAAGLRFQPSLSSIGIALQLAVIPSIIAKFRAFFSRAITIVSILAFGLLINAVLLYSIMNVKDPDLGMALMALMIYTVVVIPDVAATLLLIDEKTRSWEIFAFYFWFLISVALAILFLMSSNTATPSTVYAALSEESQPLQLLALAALYLELTVIPSVLVLLYKRVRIFLVFVPLPLLLGYALLFTGRVAYGLLP